MLDRGTARGPCRSCKPGRRIPLGGRVHPARSAERAGLTKQPSLYWKSSFPGLADEARAPCPENPGGSLPFPKARRRPFCGAGGFWGADASPICNTRSDFFQGGVLFFLIALCYINKKRVAMSVSPAHSCALFFLCGRSVDKEATAGLGRRHPGDEICGPLVRARRLGDIRNRIAPLEPLWPAACGRQSRQNLAGGGFSWQMQAKKRDMPARQSPLGEKGPACGQRGAPCCLPVAALLTKRNIMRTRYMRAIADTIRLRRHRMYLCCPAGGVRWNRRKLRWNRKQTIFLKRKRLEN